MSKKERAANRTERAAEIQVQQARRERDRKMLIVAVVVVVLAAVVAAGVLLSGRDDAAPAASGSAPKATASGQSLVVGNDPSAATKIVIYEDFLCPYCRELETSSRGFLRTDAKKGAVQVEYRPFHLLQDDYSTLALTAWAAVLKNGTPAQALKFHDLLYDNQPYESDTNKPGIDDLVALAKKAGVTDSTVLDAMKQPDQAFVDAADAAAQKANVQGTPTVLVNGKQLDGASIADLSDQLKKLGAQG
ncbi:MAG: oxidoreductase [Marmoricola sp.]|nr:oxidoreductase [Marmoricola sp.]